MRIFFFPTQDEREYNQCARALRTFVSKLGVSKERVVIGRTLDDPFKILLVISPMVGPYEVYQIEKFLTK